MPRPSHTRHAETEEQQQQKEQQQQQQFSQLLHSVLGVAEHAAPAAGQQAVSGRALAPSSQAPRRLHLHKVVYAGFEAKQNVCTGSWAIRGPLRDVQRQAGRRAVAGEVSSTPRERCWRHAVMRPSRTLPARCRLASLRDGRCGSPLLRLPRRCCDAQQRE